MRFSEYGCSSGTPVVYFHGVPGSPAEAAVLAQHAQLNNLRVLCFERFSLVGCASAEAYYQQIAVAIRAEIGDAAVDFIGFSIGSQVALGTAFHLQEQVRNVHLLSAVAPLHGGDFLNAMAGKAVFSLAQSQPWLFRLLARWQAFLAARFPAALFRLLFASAQGQDAVLASQVDFQRFMADVLRGCFSQGTFGYCRDIQQFVAPWSAPNFTGDIRFHLWHGTDDNWSPIAMADYLAATLPAVVGVHRMAGLSHYSCLYQAAPTLCQALAQR